MEPPATPNFAATVAIELSSGEILESQVNIPRGEPERFLDLPQQFAKFNGLVGECFPRAEDAEIGEHSVESLAAFLLAVDENGGSGQSVLDVIEATWPKQNI